MPPPRQTRLPVQVRPRSLVFQGDTLVDWVGGGARWHLHDGSFQRASVNYAYPFDAAVTTASGEWVVLYTRLGTKGVILHDGTVHREINRSFYHANEYEYPIALLADPNGRTLLAHCPNAYNELELADIATGECLTPRTATPLADVFYSRLSASPSGRHLVSAGWIWHPIDVVQTLDMAAALGDRPDSAGAVCHTLAVGEDCSAAWSDDDLLVVTRGAENEPEGWDDHGLPPGHLGIFSMVNGTFLSTSPIADRIPAGPIMPVDGTRAIFFHKHPRLLSFTTGEVVHEWPDLDTGNEAGAILRGRRLRPPIAFGKRRFAVAGEGEIIVVDV